MRKRLLPVIMASGLLLALSACGFHLRRGAELPPSMQEIHLTVSSIGDLQRQIARQLELAGATLVDEPGPGVAEMHVTRAAFATTALTYTGRARVGEFSIAYHLNFEVRDAKGNIIEPQQTIRITREYTYDARQPVGSESQNEQLKQSMVSDAVQAMMFRLRAVAEHDAAAVTPASASSAAR